MPRILWILFTIAACLVGLAGIGIALLAPFITTAPDEEAEPYEP